MDWEPGGDLFGGNDAVANIETSNVPVIIDEDKTKITIEQIRACAPLGVRKNIDQDMVDMINSSMDDVTIRDEYREHILSWVNVMQEGKWKLTDYANAVKYVTYKLTGDTQMSAWVKVFPDRFQRLVDKGIDSKSISAHVSMYNGNPLVVKIVERTLPPLHIINSDILQEAINVEAELMRSAKSETVKQKAAATLIEHLKAPENLKLDISVGVSNDTVEDLREITMGLAIAQQKAIKDGNVSAKGIAEMSISKKLDEDIVDAEYEEMEVTQLKRGSRLKDFF